MAIRSKAGFGVKSREAMLRETMVRNFSGESEKQRAARQREFEVRKALEARSRKRMVAAREELLAPRKAIRETRANMLERARGFAEKKGVSLEKGLKTMRQVETHFRSALDWREAEYRKYLDEVRREVEGGEGYAASEERVFLANQAGEIKKQRRLYLELFEELKSIGLPEKKVAAISKELAVVLRGLLGQERIDLATYDKLVKNREFLRHVALEVTAQTEQKEVQMALRNKTVGLTDLVFEVIQNAIEEMSG